MEFEIGSLWELLRAYGTLIITFWPLFLLAVAPALLRGAVKFVKTVVKKQRLAKAGMREIDVMDGESFEVFLETLFERQGYKVHRTRYQGDFGADLVLSKAGVKTVVQAKRASNNVGVKAVQEVLGAKGYYKATEAVVVTNSKFTRAALQLAQANHVSLWDRDALTSAVPSVRETRREPGLERVQQ